LQYNKLFREKDSSEEDDEKETRLEGNAEVIENPRALFS